MARRVSLPAADDLFRPTTPAPPVVVTPEPVAEVVIAPPPKAAPTKAAKRPSGRVRHDEKMTVYVTSDELLDLEHARLVLRREQGIAIDRGRLVREAVALALADLEANGAESAIVRRLVED